MLAAFQAPSDSHILNLAFRCLITGYFGCAYRHQGIQQIARNLYSGTLSLLRKTLMDSSQAQEFDVLGAACLLTVYEYTAFTSKTGWLEHLRGIAALFRLKGPSCFQVHPFRALFSFMRMSIMFAALTWQERSFLEEDEWQKILVDGDELTAHTSRITNLLARFPGLIEDTQVCKRNQEMCVSERRINGNTEIVRALYQTLEDLESWYQVWRISFPSQLPESMPPFLDAQGGSKVLRREFMVYKSKRRFCVLPVSRYGHSCP